MPTRSPRTNSYTASERAAQAAFCFGEKAKLSAKKLAEVDRMRTNNDKFFEFFEFFEARYLAPTPTDDDERFECGFDDVARVICLAIWAGELPHVWETIKTLQSIGHDRDRIIRELVTLVEVEGIGPNDALGETTYSIVEANANELPLPLPSEVALELVTTLQENQGIVYNDLLGHVATTFDLEWYDDDDDEGDVDDEDVVGEAFGSRYLDLVAERMIREGEIVSLNDDRLVEPAALIRNMTFTTRMDVATSKQSHVFTGVDLAAFAFDCPLRVNTGRMALGHVSRQNPAGIAGGPGWLPEITEPSLLSFRLHNTIDLDITVLPSDAPLASANEARIAAAMREAYDRNFDGCAVETNVVLYDAILHDPTLFSEPVRPLCELLADAGMLTEGDFVFHHQHAWMYLHNLKRAIGSIARTIGMPDAKSIAIRTLSGAVDRLAGRSIRLITDDEPVLLTSQTAVYEVEPPLPLSELALALPSLLSPDVFGEFSYEFLGELGSTQPPPFEARDAFIGQALAATGEIKGKSSSDRQTLRAILYLLSSMHHEIERDFVAAENAIRMARVEQDTLIEPIRRLAWYALERNDVRNALTMFQMLRDTDNQDPQLERQISDLRSHASSASPKVGRNDRCWCGSGKKFKQCHLVVGAAADLAPLPERAALLWIKARMYVEIGIGAVHLDPFEEAFATGFAPEEDDAPGGPVPFAFDVGTGHETGLHSAGHTLSRQLGFASDIALIEGGLLKKYLLERGSQLSTDEQFLLTTWCMADRGIYEVLSTTSDTMTVRNTKSFLEHTIDTSHDQRERTPVGTRICAFVASDSVNARIFGSRFHVPVGRVDQVQDLLDDGMPEELAEWIGGLFGPPRIVRGNTGMQSILDGIDTDDLDLSENGEGMNELMRRVRGRFESNWIDESVPALRGSTPRQVAADPTRRQEVVQLINSFGGEDENTPMRPSRLRALLGINPDES